MTSVLELQSLALSRVREMRLTMRDAEKDYMAAVQAARDAQCSAQQIAMAAGVTRQAIHKTLRKGT
jgi:DNA-binding phage protein